jgi:hypothetical protein
MIVGTKDLGPSVDQHAIPDILDVVRSGMRNRRDTTYAGRMIHYRLPGGACGRAQNSQ